MSKPHVAQQSVLMDVEPDAAGPGQTKAPVDKTFRRYDQDQPMLLAPDLRDWLAADHPARWVDDLVEQGLDLSAIYADYTEVRGDRAGRGAAVGCGVGRRVRSGPPR